MNKAIVIAVLLASFVLGGCATRAGPQAINEVGRLQNLPASTHRNLLAYAQAHAAQTGGKAAEPARLIVPMLDQFMASDRAFVRGRKGRVDS